MEEEKIKEQIHYKTELLKLIWFSLIATAGGTIGLFSGELTIGRLLTAVEGTVLAGLLLHAVDQLNQRIERLLS